MLAQWQLQWQVSAGRLSELLIPAAYALAVLLSALVLADARRRRLGASASAAWTLSTLLLPHVALPLYLIARIYTRPRTGDPAGAVAEADYRTPSDERGAEEARTAMPAGDFEGAGAEARGAGAAEGAVSEAEAGTSGAVAGPAAGGGVARALRRHAPPLFYAATLLACGAVYFYLDHASVDARLARAEHAKLEGRTARAAEEYRGALARREDAHVRKLLGLELSKMGRWGEALEELRAAERGGAPDDALDLYLASALDSLGRREEASRHYESYLAGAACAPPLPAPACDGARRRLNEVGQGDGGS